MTFHIGADKNPRLIQSALVMPANANNYNPHAKLAHGGEAMADSDSDNQSIGKRLEISLMP